MSLKYNDRPLSWLMWHPHQRFWNRSLMNLIKKLSFIPFLSGFLIRVVIYFDSFLLYLSTIFSGRNTNKRGYTKDKQVNYFDLGTHEKANEINWISKEVFPGLSNPVKIYAFEANPFSYKKASKNTEGVANMTFYNMALVSEIPESKSIRLYIAGDGLGDSIYRSESENYIDVEARKLSEVIKTEGIELENSVNILRMNIEGAEYDVIKDLVDSGLVKHFDAFYGMWDDLSKISYEQDKGFRELMKRGGIHPFPFNGRDMKHPVRLKLIRRKLKRTIFG